MFTALRHRAYRHLFMAHVVALLGTGMSTIALGFLAVEASGGDAAGIVGTLLGIKMVTFVVVAPFAPAIARRIGPKRLLVITDFMRAAVALSLPFVDNTTVALTLVVVLQSSSALFTPTFQALIPTVVTDQREYTGALALTRLAYDLEQLVSPSIAGLILIVAPSSALFFGTAAGFLGSALLILSAVVPKRVVAVDEPRPAITLGARLVFGHPALRGMLILNLGLAFVGAVPAVLTIPLVVGELGESNTDATMLLAAFGVGSLTSAMLMPRLIERLGVRRYVLTGLTVISAAIAVTWPLLALLPASGALPWLFGVWFVAGLGNSAVITPGSRVVRDHVTEAQLPDAFAAQFALNHGWWLMGYPLAGWGASAFGSGPTTLVLAILSFICLTVVAATWHTCPRREPEDAGAAGDADPASAAPDACAPPIARASGDRTEHSGRA